jgi:hypothetical protein
MAINVVVSNDDLTVLGPPASIDLQVDIGPEGPRGSYIYSGFNDPNTVSGPFINNPQEVGDLYYRTSNNTIYQYTSQPGGDQWIEITSLQVVANDAQELYDQAELLSASSLYWAQSASVSSAQAIANALAASALYVSAPYASATYLTMLSASSTYLTIAAANSLDTLPSQTGNNGKFLSTTGASAYWQTLNVDLSPYLTLSSASSTYLPKTGGTVSGDLVVNGNLTVSGSATQINTSDLLVNDPLIYLAVNASGVYANDLLDVGFTAAYGPHPNGGSAHYHRGLVFDKTDDKWKLFSGTPHPIDNYIDFTSATYDTLKAGTFEGNLTGTSSSANFVSHTGVVGLSTNYSPLNVSINSQSASYTLVLSDAGKMVEISNASANTLTVPADSTSNFPVGTQISILQTGTGQTTVTNAVGVTINGTPGLKLRTQWSIATLIKRAANTWVLLGDTAA